MKLDKALDGITILDLTRLLPGPLCTKFLADMGAQVIKVEDKEVGDYARHYPPFDENGVGMAFNLLNHNKQIKKMNLKDSLESASFREMIKSADVLVESFRPGVLDSLGFSFDELKAINPKIILCSISGYGQKSQLKDKAGHDINYMGYAGLLSTLEIDGSIPVPGFQMADVAGGSLTALSSILSAILQVGKTGEGLHLDISMTHALSSFFPILHFEKKYRTPGIITGESACYQVYRTSDKKFMALGAMEKKFWDRFCEGIERPEWKSRHPGTDKEFELLQSDVQKVVESRSQDEWIKDFKDRDACFTPVRDPLDSIAYSGGDLDFPLK